MYIANFSVGRVFVIPLYWSGLGSDTRRRRVYVLQSKTNGGLRGDLLDSVFWGSFAGFTIMLHAPHYRSRGVGGVSGLQVLYAVHELNFKSSAPQTLVWRCEKP